MRECAAVIGPMFTGSNTVQLYSTVVPYVVLVNTVLVRNTGQCECIPVHVHTGTCLYCFPPASAGTTLHTAGFEPGTSTVATMLPVQ